MKIAVINNLNSGSTGHLSISLVRYLQSHGEDARFYYAYGKKNECGVRFSNKFFLKLNNLFSLCGFNRYAAIRTPTKKLIKYLKTFEPDILNIQCLNIGSVNLKMLFAYAKKINIPVVITCHAFFYSTGNCGYPVNRCTKYMNSCHGCNHSFFATKSIFKRTHKNFVQMKNWLSQCNIQFACVSDYVTSMTKLSPITNLYKSRTIINGIETNVFKPISEIRENKSNGKIRILFTCSDTRGKLKGFPNFIALLNRFRNNPDFEFVFVGKMHKRLESLNLINLGALHSKEEMADAYRKADLTIMLSKDETFGMPIAESLCCGTPVAFFRCGGCEAITIKEYSGIFDYGDIDSLSDYLLEKKYLSLDRAEIAKIAKQKFDTNLVNEEYLKLIYEMVKK